MKSFLEKKKTLKQTEHWITAKHKVSYEHERQLMQWVAYLKPCQWASCQNIQQLKVCNVELSLN